MATGHHYRLYQLIGLTWVLVFLWYLPICHSLTIDQIIARATKHSPKGCGPIYEKNQKTVKVGLDMIFTVEEWARLVEMNNTKPRRHTVHRRDAIVETARARYWPNGVIYYHINRLEFSRWDVRVLESAMDEWMRHTCVHFKPASPYARNRIVFVDGDGCASNVGMSGNPQPVVLSRGCRTKGVVIHELGHVLGFNHEQTRPDRDYYVKVRWENIPRDMQYNFRQYTWSVVRNMGVPYDYLSIMHYGQKAFTGNGRVTIETRDPRYQDLIGNRRGLSFWDIKAANILYNCKPPSDRCSLQDDDCPGQGFVSKDCTCWCPTKDIYTHPRSPYYVCSAGGSGQQGGGQPYSRQGQGQSSTGQESQGSYNSSKCEDQNTNCQMWEQRGECQNNPDYMHVNCRKACRLCDKGEESSCSDTYMRCGFWQEKGYCGRSSPFSKFITANCKKTCGVCTTGPDPSPKPGPEGGKTTTSSACERQCADDNEQCQTWADRGECIATSDYMLRYCRKACNACCMDEGKQTGPVKPQIHFISTG